MSNEPSGYAANKAREDINASKAAQEKQDVSTEAEESEPLGIRFWRKLKRVSIMSAIFCAVSVVIGLVYSLVVEGYVLISHLINTNFIVASFVMIAGFVMLVIPARKKPDGPIDHTNYAQIVLDARMKRRIRAYETFYVSFGIFIIAGVVDVLLWGMMQ